MRVSILFLFILLASLISESGYAFGRKKTPIDSTEIADSTVEASKSAKKRYIDISVEYGSNFTYRNQIDQTSAADPYIYPNLYYKDKTGLWGSIGGYRLINNYVDKLADGRDTSIAPDLIETDFSAGWDYKFWGNTDVTLSYMFSIYNRKFPLVAQALRNTYEAYVGHDFKLINTGLRYDYCNQTFTATLKGKKVNVPVHDNYLMWETSREWFFDDVFKTDDEFDLDPMFTVLAGTDNFIGQFIVARYPTSKTAATYAANASKFLIQQFTLSVPVAYTIGNLTLTPDFEYTILTQKVTETSPTRYPIYKFTAAYRFNFK